MLAVYSDAYDASRYSDGDTVVRHWCQHQRAGTNDAVAAHAGGDSNAFADPRIATDRDRCVVACLLSQENVETIGSVLVAAVHDGNMRSNQHIVFDRGITDGTVISNVDRAADRNPGVGENGSKRNARIGTALSSCRSQKRVPQMNSGKARKQAEKL